jgi:membrane protein
MGKYSARTGGPSRPPRPVREDLDVGLVDRIEAGLDRAVVRVRKRSPAFDHLWQAGTRFVDVLAGRLAAAISYYGFFAAFSLAVLAYSILGRVIGTNDSNVLTALNDYLQGSLPWVAETAREVGRGEVTVLAAVGLLVAGVGWVEALRSSLRGVWLLNQQPGHWFVRRLVDLVMLLGLGLLLGLSLAMTSAVGLILTWLAPDTNLGNVLLRPIGPALEFIVNVVLASALLSAVPRLRLSPRRLVWPVLIVALGIQLLNTIGREFIAASEQRPVYALVAGSVGLLIYLYVLNQLILFGAALAATSTAGSAFDLATGNPAELPTGPVEIPGEPTGNQAREPR